MTTDDRENPREKFRVLPTPVPAEDLVTESAVDPVPGEIANTTQRSHLRLVTEAGG